MSIVKNILRKIEKLISSIVLSIFGTIPVTKANKFAWQQRGQEGEFQFHLTNKWRETSGFMDQTRKLFAYLGFFEDDYRGKTIIDLGAGSKLRTKYFSGADIIAIEPLAKRFQEEIDWCDLTDAKSVYSSPAEERIEELIGKADIVISINVLDHCYDFDIIIGNIAAYLKADALAFLSFDEHRVTDEMHPLVLNEEVCEEIFYKNGLIVVKTSKGAGDVLPAYGHGDYCLNYWLKKAQ